MKPALVASALLAGIAGGLAISSILSPSPQAMTSSPTRSGGIVLIGVPTILDGDTLRVQGQSVRLNGIDAEEVAHFGKSAEPHGEAARAALQSIVGIGASVRCELNGDNTYDRLVGTCFNARGQDVAAELIRKGLALDCARFSGGRYRRFEPVGVRARLAQKPYC